MVVRTPWQPAHLVLAAHKGAGPQEHVQPHGRRRVEERGEVALRVHLAPVVRALDAVDAALPVRLGDARVGASGAGGSSFAVR